MKRLGVPDGEDASALRGLVRALQRYPSLFTLSYDAVALYDRNGIIVAGNPASRALIRGELRGDHFGRHMGPGELERAQAHFATALSGEPVEFESVFKSRDGTPINVIARLVPALAGETIVGVFGIARDITPQRQAEAGRDESRQQFRSLFEQHPDSISMVDASGRYVRLNAAAERMLGLRSADVAGKRTGEVFPPGPETEDLDSFVLDLLSAGEPTRYERTVSRADGSQITLEGTAVPVVVRDAVTGLFLMSRDVTARKRMHDALALQSRRTRALYRLASEVGADPNDQARSALAFGVKELGFESGFVASKNGEFQMTERAGSGLPDDDDPHFRRLIRETIAGSGLLEAGAAAPSLCRSFIGCPLDLESGRYGALGFVSRSATMPLTDFDREFVRAVAELTAVSIERAIEEERLQSLAHFDVLTGLPNRLMLSNRFAQALAAARRRGESLAVYFVDVDKLKSVNDTHGHLVGDEVLRLVAQRLRKACRESDTVARLAGDEFIVLRPGPAVGARPEALAARLRAELEAPCEIRDAQLKLSACIGISVFPWDGKDERELLENADAALYAAKAAGTGSIRRFAN